MNNAKIEKMLKEFAKANKISQTKLHNLAGALITEVKPVRPGKKPDPQTAKLREKVRKDFKEATGTTVTAVELSTRYKTDVVTMNNVMRYLAHEHDMFKAVGKEPRPQGMRGRSRVIWAVQ